MASVAITTGAECGFSQVLGSSFARALSTEELGKKVRGVYRRKCNVSPGVSVVGRPRMPCYSSGRILDFLC
jgi:hypothetical protein